MLAAVQPVPDPSADSHVVLTLGGGGRVEARVDPGRRQTVLRRLHADDTQAWYLPLPGDGDAVELARAGGRLFAVVYRSGATASRVAAVDEASGRLLWERDIQGPAPSLHSKYSNRVSLTATEDEVLVEGLESAGRYSEMLDATTGATRAREVTPP